MTIKNNTKHKEYLLFIILFILLIVETATIVTISTNLSSHINSNPNTLNVKKKKKSELNAQNVSIIGDSITFLAKTTILKTLPGLKEENINAKNGRLWNEGINIAKDNNNKLKKTVIFALGTNSSSLKDSDITAALDAIGMDKNIVFTTNYTLEKNYYYNNRLLRKYAKKYDNIYLADWSKAVRKNPTKYLEPDPIHPNSIGEVLYANTLLKTLKKIKDL